MSDNYKKNLANNIKAVLSEIGENTERNGLLKTPKRVAKSMKFLTNGNIVGLSKIPRIVDVFARRLQVQKRLTDEIKDCLQDTLKPTGVAVVIEAQHLCMQMRGVEKQHSYTTTSAFSGFFMSDDKTRSEFINLIKQ